MFAWKQKSNKGSNDECQNHEARTSLPSSGRLVCSCRNDPQEDYALEDIATVARLWADTFNGNNWPIVKKCREGFKDEPELLGPFLDVLSLAGLTHLATAYINSRPDFMNQSAETCSEDERTDQAEHPGGS
jgi:hypothetical protein